MNAGNHLKNKYGKVAVLYGGKSAEREVSLKTGQAIYRALFSQGVDAVLIDAQLDLTQELINKNFSRVFNALHGGDGENGTIQGFLDIVGLPYTGCGLLASAITMDKLICKKLWEDYGLPVLPVKRVESANQAEEIINAIGLPMAIKPVNAGSSVGITKVTQKQQFSTAYALAKQYDDVVIAEPWVSGKELTLPVFDAQVYPLIEIQTPREFYDYDAKYIENTTKYICPCHDLSDELVAEINTIAKSAYAVTQCKGIVRADFRLDDSGKPWLFELNTMPGMTERSLVPMSMKQAGVTFEQLVLQMLDQTLPIKKQVVAAIS